MTELQTLFPGTNIWLNVTLVVVGIVGLTYLLRTLILILAKKWLRVRGYHVKDLVLSQHFGASLSIFISSILCHLALPFFPISEKLELRISRIVGVIIIVSSTWVMMKIADLVKKILFSVFEINGSDNIRQRKMQTQLQFVFRTVGIALAVIGFAGVLLSFQEARKFGASLIASASVVSILVGFAAQKSLSNFIAGFQIAFTQPIKLDDYITVEKENGTVEEITMTYVVVRMWDLRRMVLPITYFVEKPFQNWTRSSTDILGGVLLYLDYSVPVERLRAELQRILEASSLWDQQVCKLQLTDASPQTVEVRCVVSAADIGSLGELRLLVREQMLAFIQKNYPNALPRTRNENVITASS